MNQYTKAHKVKEVLDAVAEMMSADTEAAAIDVMLYGKTLVCITADGMHRVPPEEWHKFGGDIVLPNKSKT